MLQDRMFLTHLFSRSYATALCLLLPDSIKGSLTPGFSHHLFGVQPSSPVDSVHLIEALPQHVSEPFILNCSLCTQRELYSTPDRTMALTNDDKGNKECAHDHKHGADGHKHDEHDHSSHAGQACPEKKDCAAPDACCGSPGSCKK